MLLQVVLEQRRDLLAAFAERRQVERQNLEAVEQILAEAALGDQLLEVGVGGGDDPHVNLDGVRLAERMNLMVLEEAKQLGLDLDCDVADFVEEQGAAVRRADDARERSYRH